MRKSRLFLPALKSENASLSVIWLKLNKMWKFLNRYEESLPLAVYKLAKYVRNCVVFWKNLHSWQKFYTTAGRDGRDKSQLCDQDGYDHDENDDQDGYEKDDHEVLCGSNGSLMSAISSGAKTLMIIINHDD